MALTNFTIESVAKGLPDPQRLWAFNVQILNPVIVGLFSQDGGSKGSDGLTVRCEGVQIPQISIDQMETNFMGTKQYFPGKKTAGGDVTLDCYETENQFIANGFYKWHQAIFNHDPENGAFGGGSMVASKTGLITDIDVFCYKYSKELMPYSYRLHNCWVKSVSNPQFAFSSGDNVKVNVTLACDYWKLVKAGTNADVAITQ